MGIQCLDIGVGQRIVIEYGDQFAACYLGLDLPGGAPADTQALTHPLEENLPVTARQVACNPNGGDVIVTAKCPAALLTAV